MYVCNTMYVCSMYVCMHVCMYACIKHIYIYAYVHTYIHTYAHTYTHTYIHTYVSTYIHVCIYYVCLIYLQQLLDPSSNFSKYRGAMESAMSTARQEKDRRCVVPFFSLIIKDLYFQNEALSNR